MQLLTTKCTAALVAASCLAVAPAALAQDEQVTIRIWDDFNGPDADAAEQILQIYMDENPNVRVVRESYTFEQLRATSWLALKSGDGPDIIYMDVAPAREVAEAGLILPLDDYAESFDWISRIFEAGRQWGTFDGTIYGLGIEYEFVGVYYNETLIEEAGLDLPQTLEELKTFCQAAAEMGYVPMAHSQNPGWQGYFSFVMPLTNILGVDGVRQLVIDGEGRWDTPEVIRAIEVFHNELRDANCFVEQVNALDFPGATDMFGIGEALMFPTGTWAVGSIDEIKDPDHVIKMMPFPSIEGTDGERVFTTGMGSLFTIASSSEHPEIAADVLDGLITDQAISIWIEQGVVPPMPVSNLPEGLSDLKTFVLETLQQAGRGTSDLSLGYNIDLLVPEAFNSMMRDGFQAVMAGTKTAEEQAADLQEMWAK